MIERKQIMLNATSPNKRLQQTAVLPRSAPAVEAQADNQIDKNIMIKGD